VPKIIQRGAQERDRFLVILAVLNCKIFGFCDMLDLGDVAQRVFVASVISQCFLLCYLPDCYFAAENSKDSQH
jgi:hypothetical protein